MRLALKPLGAKPARTLPSWVGEVAPDEARVRVTPVRNGGHENVQTPEGGTPKGASLVRPGGPEAYSASALGSGRV